MPNRKSHLSRINPYFFWALRMLDIWAPSHFKFFFFKGCWGFEMSSSRAQFELCGLTFRLLGGQPFGLWPVFLLNRNECHTACVNFKTLISSLKHIQNYACFFTKKILVCLILVIFISLLKAQLHWRISHGMSHGISYGTQSVPRKVRHLHEKSHGHSLGLTEYHRISHMGCPMGYPTVRTGL
jgi:hypothetical protein